MTTIIIIRSMIMLSKSLATDAYYSVIVFFIIVVAKVIEHVSGRTA